MSGQSIWSKRGASITAMAFIAAGVPLAGAALAQKPAEQAQLADFIKAYKRPTSVPAPKDNAVTPDRVALGRTLFFDPRLSGSCAISC